MVSFNYSIQEANGIHARPAGLLVKMVKEMPCTVTLSCGNRKAEGTKLFSIMEMSVKCGETVTVSVEGTDEKSCADKLKALFEEHF